MVQARGLVRLRQDYDAELIQDGAHMRELEVDRAQGSIAQLHGVMLKVELESDGRLHSVLMEGLRRKCMENRSLFQREARDIWVGLGTNSLMET